MVNVKTVFSAVVVMSCFTAIAVYMRNNNLSTDDISLIDVCYKMEEIETGWKATCQGFEDRKYTWDTTVPCFGEFGADKYTYTPRELMSLTGLSRNLKGKVEEEEITKNAHIVNVCEKYITDEVKQEYQNWVAEVQALAANNSTGNRDLGWHGRGWFNLRGNYKACSIKTCFLTGTCGDTAACEPRPKNGHCDGNWRQNSRGARNYLNNGCVYHDECLSEGYTHNNPSLTAYGSYPGNSGLHHSNCDRMLERYARACLNHPCDDDREAATWTNSGITLADWLANRNGYVKSDNPVIAPPPPPPPPRRRRRRRGW